MKRLGINVFFTGTEELLDLCNRVDRYKSVDDFAWDFMRYLRWSNLEGAIILHKNKYHEIYTAESMRDFMNKYPELKEVLLKGNNDKEG